MYALYLYYAIYFVATGMINAFSVALEIPFLFLGDRIMKRFSIWTWLLIGMCTGALRFIVLSFLRAGLDRDGAAALHRPPGLF